MYTFKKTHSYVKTSLGLNENCFQKWSAFVHDVKIKPQRPTYMIEI